MHDYFPHHPSISFSSSSPSPSHVTNAGKYVRLNIGGYRYDTTVGTLLRYRSPGGSFFSGLLSGNFEPLKDGEGALFIDRDGLPFAPILRYLRTGEFVLPEHLSLKEVLREAAFYCVPLPVGPLGGGDAPLCETVEPRFDGVYMDKDMRLLIQFLPTQNRVKIAAKLEQNLWLDFCRTNDSYFRYVQAGRFIIISPVGIQDEYSVFAGALYPDFLQPDTFCRLSGFGQLRFLASHSRVAVPRLNREYVIAEDYAFKSDGQQLSVRISMLSFSSATGLCSMIVKIGSQPQRVKSFPYEIAHVADRPHDELLPSRSVRPQSSASASSPSPLPSAVLPAPASGGAIGDYAGHAFSPGSPPDRYMLSPAAFSGDESDVDEFHEGHGAGAPLPPPLPPVSRGEGAQQPQQAASWMLREVIIKSAALTKTDIHLYCFDNGSLVEISFFIGMKSARTYHPRITRVFIEVKD